MVNYSLERVLLLVYRKDLSSFCMDRKKNLNIFFSRTWLGVSCEKWRFVLFFFLCPQDRFSLSSWMMQRFLGAHGNINAIARRTCLFLQGFRPLFHFFLFESYKRPFFSLFARSSKSCLRSSSFPGNSLLYPMSLK